MLFQGALLMDGKITYHQQPSYCNKPRCRKCKEGLGHGPYWYAYQTVDGQTTRTYIGKRLPPGVQATLTTPLDPDVDGEPQPALRVFMLSTFRMERMVNQQWEIISDAQWPYDHVRALLALLLCSPERRVSRAQAMEVLKRVGPVPAGTAAGERERPEDILSQTLQRLRKVLASARSGADRAKGNLLRTEGEMLVLAGQTLIWVDADAFETLCTHPIEKQAGYQKKLEMLGEAAALYKGDFLPEGRQYKWVSARRQHLRQLWINLLIEQADLYLTQEETDASIIVLNQLLENDPTNEAAYQRLMIVLAKQKRRGEAIQTYQSLVKALQRDGGKMPGADTQALIEAVREGLEIPALPGKAVAQPVQSAAQSARISEVLKDIQIGRSNQSPLVGRGDELEALQHILEDVEKDALDSSRRTNVLPLDTQRRPQCVVLMGEIGIGKTRLAEEISRFAQRRNWAAIWSRVSPQESSVPYRLWTEALRRGLYIGAGLLPAFFERQKGSEQNTALEALRPLTALLPELGEVLPPTSLSEIFVPETKQEQLRLWQATRDLLTLISEQARLLLVLDDIQWADANSCDLLGYLCRHLAGYPILIVATCRETELTSHPQHPLRSLIAHMQRERSVRTINVAPLTNEQIGVLVAEVSRLPASMVQYIQEYAAGNPLFAEEMARSTPPNLTQNVTAALEQRLHRLSSPCQDLLQSAAVLGGSFAFPLLYGMAERGGLTDEDAVLNLLEEALQAGVLTEEGMGTRITYHFWHPLLVSHLYENISGVRRARLHLRAAEALQALNSNREEEVAATITHHLERAGAEPLAVAQFAELAGHRAYTLSAYKEAGEHYRLAIQKREEAGKGEKAREQADQEHQGYLLERLAECVMIRGHYEEARKLYERVLQVRNRLRTDDANYAAQVRALLWSEIGWAWRYQAESAQAWHCYRQGERVLREAHVESGPAWARLYHLQSALYLYEGRYEEARDAALTELGLLEMLPANNDGIPRRSRPTRIQRILASDPVDLGRVYRRLGGISTSVGQRSEALKHLNTALTIYERYDYKREVAHISCDLGYNYFKRAEYGLSREALHRSLSLARSINDDPLISVIYSDLGALAASGGELEEAEQWYKRALEMAEQTSDREYQSRWSAALAPILEGLEKSDEARTSAVRALLIGRATRKDPCVGEALLALGILRIMQAGKVKKLPRTRKRLLLLARRDLQRAQTLPGLEAETRARAQLELARIAYELGEERHMREALRQALEMAQRYELAHEEVQARQLEKLLNRKR
jgi:DNA-binding SARP family transcriptional activator